MSFRELPMLPILGGFVAGAIVTAASLPLWTRHAVSPDAGSGNAVTLAEPSARIGSVDMANAYEIDDPRISFRVLKRIAEVKALNDPAQAVKDAMKIPGHDNREAYLAAALQTWGETDGLAAAEWCMENFEGELLTDALYFVSDGWAESDPQAAGDWFNTRTDGSVRDDGLWEALEAWGRKDPESAFEWSKGLDEYVKSMVMDGLAEGWAAVDPEAAAEAAKSFQGREYEYDFLTAVATQWAGLDPARAAAWSEGVLHEGMREAVFLEIGEIWAHTDPSAAAEWVAQMPEGENRKSLLSGIAIGWSEHDPDAAVDWALGLSTDEAHLTDMVGDIMFNWSNIDPGGMVDWLRQRGPGQKTDQVLTMFTDVVVEMDAEAAVAWANQMTDPQQRDRQLRKLIGQWVEREGHHATATLSKMELPASLKAEFLNAD